MYYVYILFSKSIEKKYVGFSTDLRKRVLHHNAGLNKWSKRGVPWEVIYYEAYCNETDARKRELFLKSGRGREIINKQLESTLQDVIGDSDETEV